MSSSLPSHDNDASVSLSLHHETTHKWTLWSHFPHDKKWTEASYTKIVVCSTIEEVIIINESLPDGLLKNCMLFWMKNDIFPMWEHPLNRHGGVFKYRIPNKNIRDAWRNLSFATIGNTISENKHFAHNNINGITISPKKGFCIIKIWLATCDYRHASIISSNIPGIIEAGCLFVAHDDSISAI